MKKDILANINCDSEALDRFLRNINELNEWQARAVPGVDLSNLQEEKNLNDFLQDIHLTEYFEEFRIFAKCQEWWSKLPLFNGEEMRIWFGMDKPGHLIRFRTALREQQVQGGEINEKVKIDLRRNKLQNEIMSVNRTDLDVPMDLLKSRNRLDDEVLVLFKGALATLCISAQDIRIIVDSADLHKHSLEELLYVYQDGEDLTRFGYQLVDSSCWEFQTASMVNTARAVLVIAHSFTGFQ